MSAHFAGYTVTSDDKIRLWVAVEDEYFRYPILLCDTIMWEKHQPRKLGLTSTGWRQREHNLANAIVVRCGKIPTVPFRAAAATVVRGILSKNLLQEAHNHSCLKPTAIL
jgi:hypothetical protein